MIDMHIYKVLIVEDDAIVAESLKHLLEDLSHKVIGLASTK